MILETLRWRSLALVLGGLLVAGSASAGERTPLGAVPRFPPAKDAEEPGKTMGVPGLTLKTRTPKGALSYYELSVPSAKGYCLVRRESMFELAATSTVAFDELWHVTEKDDGSATLERIRFQIASYLDRAWIKSRSTLELKALGHDLGLTAWGLRDDDGDLVVLVRGADFGVESSSSEPGIPTSSSSCAFGAVRVRAADLKKSGASVQLTGRLPAEGEGPAKIEPRLIVDVSVVKVSRDPEPVVSVRFRRRVD